MGIEMELFEVQDLNSLDFCCGVGWRAKFAKGRWTHQTNCWLAFWMLLAA